MLEGKELMSRLYRDVGGKGLPNSGQTVGQEWQRSMTQDKWEFRFPLSTWVKISRKFALGQGREVQYRQLYAA